MSRECEVIPFPRRAPRQESVDEAHRRRRAELAERNEAKMQRALAERAENERALKEAVDKYPCPMPWWYEGERARQAAGETPLSMTQMLEMMDCRSEAEYVMRYGHRRSAESDRRQA
jgi:hypothetical protein